jgi:hypothetical protein
VGVTEVIVLIAAAAVAWLVRFLARGARGIRAVSWVGLTGSEQLFVLLSEQVEKSYQQLSSAEGSA